MRIKCNETPSVSSLRFIKKALPTLFFLFLFSVPALRAAVDSSYHRVVVTVSNPEVLKQPFAFGSFYQTKFLNVPVTGQIKANSLIFSFRPERFGMYKIRFGKNIEADFILSAAENEHKINFTFTDNSYSVKIEGPEDQAYDLLDKLMQERQNLIANINQSLQKISAVNPHYYALKQMQKERSDSVKEAYNQLIEHVAVIYPNTYTAQVLVPVFRVKTRLSDPRLYREFDNHHAYYHRHFFDDMPVGDNRVLNHPAFPSQVNFYCGNFLGEYDEDYQRATDYIMHLPSTPEIKEFLRLALLSYLYKDQKMNALSYIIDNYMEGCNAESETAKLVDAVLNNPLRVGGPFPMATLYLYGANDSIIIPNAFAPGQKQVVIFWRNDCDHCRETLALLKNKKTTPDIRIVTIQLNREPNPAPDRQLLSERWLNLHCGDALDKVLNTYRIIKTPGIFFINERREVVKYANNIGEIPITYKEQ